MADSTPTWFSRLCLFATVLAFGVIMLGAYTRLTHAGLGCPDWPGCYGNMIVSKATPESAKAWTEMIHRYIAGSLGLLVLVLCISTYTQSALHRFRLHTSFMVLWVIGQALLGMWTVTLKLHPTIVMAHLMGGMILCALLWWLTLRTFSVLPQIKAGFGWALGFGLLLVIMQIMLGGWTSANYAALACTDFPGCKALHWSALHGSEAFSLLPPLDHHYEGGWLSHPARGTIHMAHRLGALILALYWIPLATLIIQRLPSLRPYAMATLVVLVAQIALGISNVIFFLPLAVAVLHNGVACLLLLATLGLNVQYQRSVTS